LIIATLGPAAALAQGPRGAGPDARRPRAGTISIGSGGWWDRVNDEYAGGVLRDEGARYSFDSLGAASFPFLTGIESAVRAAAAIPGFRATLGTSDVQVRRTRESTPLTIEAGITRRLSAYVGLQYVTAAARVETRITPITATVGLNPALISPDIAANNGALLSQLDAAIANVSGRIATCAAMPGATGCATINANPAGATALVADASAYVDAIGTVYGGRGANVGSAFLPLAGGAAQAAVAARLAGLKAQFAAFGAPTITGAAPIGAPVPLTTTTFQDMLADSAFGIAGRIAPVVRRGFGAAEFGADFTWHDTPDEPAAPGSVWWRSAVGASYRAATAPVTAADDLVGTTLASPAATVVFRSATEVGYGPRLAVGVGLTYAAASTASFDVRTVASGADAFPSADRTARMTWTPGTDLVAEIAPRWVPTEAVAIAATFAYRSRGADAYSLSATSAGAPASASPGMGLEAGPSATEQRAGISIAYSTLPAWRRGRARWPIEIVLRHFQTVNASGGTLPKIAHDDFLLRWHFAVRRDARR
jgi:hypothetical protein